VAREDERGKVKMLGGQKFVRICSSGRFAKIPIILK